jgi:cation diffusion facilitator family transporter
VPLVHDPHGHDQEVDRRHRREGNGPAHAHGLVDASILRSRAGLRAVAWSLVVLGITAVAQAIVFFASGSVALLADLVHNGGDALTAVPLGVAFTLCSACAERRAGYAVVGAIFISACVAGAEALNRLIHPVAPSHLVALAAAGVIGYLGNYAAARIRTRAGERLNSAALIADEHHARVDVYVSLAVVGSAVFVAAGAPIADPLLGLVITAVILRITWQAWRLIRKASR